MLLAFLKYVGVLWCLSLFPAIVYQSGGTTSKECGETLTTPCQLTIADGAGTVTVTGDADGSYRRVYYAVNLRKNQTLHLTATSGVENTRLYAMGICNTTRDPETVNAPNCIPVRGKTNLRKKTPAKPVKDSKKSTAPDKPLLSHAKLNYSAVTDGENISSLFEFFGHGIGVAVNASVD